MSERYFKCPDEIVLEHIFAADICTNARFILDEPLILKAGQLLLLTDGEFYVDGKKIEGRWADLRSVNMTCQQ